MSEQREDEELPLDFTQFLSGRLGLAPTATLSVLGAYLLSFEPVGKYPRLGPISHPAPRPAVSH